MKKKGMVETSGGERKTGGPLPRVLETKGVGQQESKPPPCQVKGEKGAEGWLEEGKTHTPSVFEGKRQTITKWELT